MAENIKRLRELLEHCHPLEGGDETFLLIKCMTRNRRPLSTNEIQEVKDLLAKELNSGCQVKVRPDEQAGVVNVLVENFDQGKLKELLSRLQGENAATTS